MRQLFKRGAHKGNMHVPLILQWLGPKT